MKIKKFVERVDYVKPKHWWAGHTAKCEFCRTEVELDADDKVVEEMVNISRRPIVRQGYVRCPSCNNDLDFSVFTGENTLDDSFVERPIPEEFGGATAVEDECDLQ